MKKFFLILLVFTLTVTLCSGLIGCSKKLENANQGDVLGTQQDSITTNEMLLNNINSNDTDSNDTDQSGIESADYMLMEQSGLYYIVFDSISDYQGEGQNELANLEFKSLAALKNSVTNGKLENWQKKVIATSFKKNDVGILTCDFNKLLEPKMPGECVIDGVSWSGESYSFYISTSSEIFGFVHSYSYDQYYEIYEKDFENYFDKSTITVKETLIADDGKVVTTYSTSAGDLMQVRWTYKVGQKTIVVDETYRLSMGDETLTTSDMVPTNVTLYCTEPGAYYVVDLFGFVEKPSDEWLMQFGMTQYVEKNLSVK